MPRTILVVDDSVINRTILTNILKDDYSVTEAENGAQAIEQLRSGTDISAVLLDLVMPVMDGYAVLRTMHADADMVNVPVIVMTGDSDADAEENALSLGANDFVRKPYMPKILLRRLANLIKLRETSALVNALRTDRLTGLLNREAFFISAAREISEKPEGYYILGCMDIDGFKVINDRYGAEKGDEVLVGIAHALEGIREKNGGICGRINADCFVYLYPTSLIEILPAGTHFLDGYIARSISSNMTISVGRYIVRDKSLSVSAMYDRATLAKETVKGRYDVHAAFYDETMRNRLVREHEIMNEMHHALASGQFETWLQPQYNHATGALIGAEALVRWRHPTWGLVSPGEFIPVFERNGFIYELDKYIWEQVCINLRRWIDEGRKALPVSVNISRYDLFRSDLTEVISGLTKKYGIAERLLRLEITESAFAESSAKVVNVTKALIELGFTVEIDDFGSGYSSLNTLKDVPAQVVKLDMRFLEGTGNHDRGGNIIQSVIRMAKWLGMSVIAEGVERAEQADFLKSIGCNYVQGYLYSRPLPIPEYEKLSESRSVEENLMSMETVENLDNNSFWNPESLDTLIFNSYVGAACIFEYNGGHLELARVNDKYIKTLSENLNAEILLDISWENHMDTENRDAFENAMRLSVNNRDEITGEYVYLDLPCCPERVYLRSTIRVIAHTGERRFVYCTSENITAQREAEHARRMAERKELEASARMSGIINNIDGGVSAAKRGRDGKMEIIFANKRFYSMFGFTRAQFADEIKDILDVVHPDDRERIMALAGEVITTRRNDSYEYRCIKRDGTLMWVHCNATHTVFKGSTDVVLLSVMTDVTERKKAEQKQNETDEQLRLLNDLSRELLARPDMDESINAVLSRMLTFFGSTRAKLYEQRGNEEYYLIYEVCADGVVGTKDDNPHSFGDWLDDWRSNSGAREVIYKNADDLPGGSENDRELLKSQPTRSIVAVPFFRDNRLAGFICLHNPTLHIEHTSSLRALGDYIAIMLTRRELLTRVENNAAAMKTLMDDTPGGFVRMRLFGESGLSTVYVNDAICRLRGMSAEEIIEFEKQDALASVHPDDIECVVSSLKEIIFGDGKSHAVYRLRRYDGRYVYMNAYGNITVGDDGEKYVNVFYTELSQQESKEYSVRETLPLLLSAIMQSSQNLDFAKDRDFRYICCSTAFAKFAGCERSEDVIGKTDFELFDAETAKQFRKDDIAIFEKGESLVGFTEPIPSDDGIQHYCVTSKYLLRDSANGIMGLYGSGLDVTGSRTDYERLKLVTDSMPGGIATYSISPDGAKLIYCNDGFCRLFGVSREEYDNYVKANGVLSKVHPDDVTELRRQVRALREHETAINCTYRSRKLDGSGYAMISVRSELSARKGDTYFLNAVLFDVTRQYEAEQRSEDIRNQIKVIIDNIEGGVAAMTVNDGKLRYLFMNERYTAMFGYTREEFEALPNGLDSLILDADHEKTLGCVAANDGVVTTEFRVRCKDNSIKWVHASGSVCHMEGINEDVHAAILTDITAEKTVNERMAMLSDSIPGGIATYEISADSVTLTYFSEGFGSMLGCTHDEYAMLTEREGAFALVFEEDKPGILGHIDGILKNGETGALEFRVHRKDNDGFIWVEMRCSVSEKHENVYLVSTLMTDVSERHRIIEELRVNEEGLRIAMSQMGRMICEYDIETRVLNLPELLAEKYGSVSVIPDVPDSVASGNYIDREYIPVYRAFFGAILRGEKNGTMEYRGKWANGESHWMHMEFTTILHSDGKPFKAIISVKDTTAQHDEYKLAELERERLYTAVTSMNSMVISANLTRNTYTILSYADSAWQATPASGTVDDFVAYAVAGLPEPDASKFLGIFSRNRQIAAYKEGKTKLELDFRHVDADGVTAWLRVRVIFIRNEYDNDILQVTMVRSIDDEVAHQMLLQRTYELTIDNMPNFVAKWLFRDGDVLLIEANKKYLSFMGLTEMEAFGRSITESLEPEDKEELISELYAKARTRSGIAFTSRARKANGEVCYLSVSASFFEEKDGCKIYYGTMTEITEMVRVREELRLSREEYKVASALSKRTVLRYDLRTKVLTVLSQDNGETDFACADGKALECLTEILNVTPDDKGVLENFFDGINEGRKCVTTVVAGADRSGKKRWSQLEYDIVFGSDGKAATAIISIENITHKRNTEDMLSISSTFLETAANIVNMVVFNLTTGFLVQETETPGGMLSQRAGSMYFNDIKRYYIENCVYEEDRAEFAEYFDPDRALSQHKKGNDDEVFEFRIKDNGNGKLKWMSVRSHVAVNSENGEPEVFVIFADIDAKKKEELLVRELAELDPLTGVLNRATFASRMEFLRYGLNFTLLLLDLDGFKTLNDTFGHAAGDKALIELAKSINAILRPSDIIGRLGGDEFLVGLRNMANDADIENKATIICSLARKSYSAEVHLSTSIGIAVCPRDGTDFETLYRKADKALYSAKNSGKDGFCFYRRNIDSQPDEYTRTPDDAEKALSGDVKRERMLIVEDDNLMSEIIAHVFADEYAVDSFSDGNEAVMYLTANADSVAAVLLDLVMPGMDGFQVLAKIRENRALDSVPVIVVSGTDDADAKTKALNAGATDFIEKPVEPDILRERVRSATGKTKSK